MKVTNKTLYLLLAISVAIIAFAYIDNEIRVNKRIKAQKEEFLLKKLEQDKEEKKLYNSIKSHFEQKNYMDVMFLSESYYKNFKNYNNLDEISDLYDIAIIKLDSIELEEEGSNAFKRYKLKDNPILNRKTESNTNQIENNERYFEYFNSKRSEFARAVKYDLHDPSSFQFIETKFRDNKDGTLTLIMEFRAKNGFGALVKSRAVGTFHKASKEIKDITIVQ